MQTSYTTVIVTRNRADALALSLPLHLGQSRLPQAIWVIDSSDDPSANQHLVAQLAAQSAVPLHHITAPPGMTVQRNIGLSKVTTDVVFFPDDDSLLPCDVMAAMMRVYDRDTAQIIGGVCAAEALSPPLGVLPQSVPQYEMTRADRLRAKISVQRYALEERFVPDPFHRVAAQLYGHLPRPPAWLDDENAVIVPWMTGFRMSYRTEVIRKHGFNESLGRYALFEDTDACFQVLKTHLLVGARNAEIYHHKAPARRAAGRALGAMQILNRAFVVARSGVLAGPQGRNVIAAHRRFGLYKCAQYLAGSHSAFGRARFFGALTALRRSGQLFRCAPEDLTQRYIALRREIFNSIE